MIQLEDLSPEDQVALPKDHPLRVLRPHLEPKMAAAAGMTPEYLAKVDSEVRSPEFIAELRTALAQAKKPAEKAALSAALGTYDPKTPDVIQFKEEDLSPEDRIKSRKGSPMYMDPSKGGGTLSIGPFDTGIKTGEATDRMLAGAGKFFSDTGSGVRQLAATALNPIGQGLVGKDILPQDYAGEKERKTLDAPLMDTVAGNVGYAGASLASLALPGSAVAGKTGTAVKGLKALSASPGAQAMVAKYAPQAISAAAMAALSPTTKEGERAGNMAFAGATSPVFQKAGELVGRAARPAAQWVGDHVSAGPLLRKSWGSTATQQQKQTVARAMMNDIPVYPNQLDNPGVSMSRGRSEDQLKALTKAVNRTMGEETENIGGAFITARDRLSDTYKALLRGKTINLNNQSGPIPPNAVGTNGGPSPSQYVQKLMDIAKEHNTGSPIIQPSKDLNDAIEQAISYAQNQGSLTGKQYQELMRRYAESAKKAAHGTELNISDPRAAKGFSDLTDALTEQAEKVMHPYEIDAFRQANKQWRNMKTLESLAPTKVDGVSDYNPSALARKLARTDKDAFLYGRGDPTLSDLGKFGSTYMGLEANAPQGLFQRGKALIKNSAPILVGDAAGAVLAGQAMGADSHDEGESSLAAKGLKYGALAMLMHGLLTGGKNALNPRMTMDQLNLPRGALSELYQRMQMAPAAAALMNNHRGDE